MIVVLGRPGLTADGRLDGAAARIALAAATSGGRVELVGTVGDDADGDAAVVELGRAGIGHAAVLRDPTGRTPRAGGEADWARAPRLDAADIELALSYLAECQVLVVGEPLPVEEMRVVVDAAGYHRAPLIVIAAEPGESASVPLPDDATVLSPPDDDSAAFAALVGRYAVLLDGGRRPADAWREAVEQAGWQQGEA